jgi:hypothetical protein
LKACSTDEYIHLMLLAIHRDNTSLTDMSNFSVHRLNVRRNQCLEISVGRRDSSAARTPRRDDELFQLVLSWADASSHFIRDEPFQILRRLGSLHVEFKHDVDVGFDRLSESQEILWVVTEALLVFLRELVLSCAQVDGCSLAELSECGCVAGSVSDRLN